MPVPGSLQGWQRGSMGAVGSAERGDAPDPHRHADSWIQRRCLLASRTSSNLFAGSPQDTCHSPSSSSFPVAAPSRAGGRGTGTGLRAPEPTPCLHALQTQLGRTFAGSIPKPAEHLPPPHAQELHQHTPLLLPRLGFLSQSICTPSQINTSLQEPKGLWWGGGRRRWGV